MLAEPKKRKRKNRAKAKKLSDYFAEEMSKHKDVESLNKNVLTPFILALEQISDARSYMLNIYGNKSNLVFTSEDDAEAIFCMIEEYLDGKDSVSES